MSQHRMSDEDIAGHLLDLARAAGADAAESMVVRGDSLSVNARNGRLEDIERSEGFDVGLRVFVGARSAGVSASTGAPDALRTLAERAVAMARAAPEDEHAALADPSQLAGEDHDLDLYDATPADAAKLRDVALAAEAACRESPAITNTEGSGASWGASRSIRRASNGFAGGRRHSMWTIFSHAIAGEGLAMQGDYDYDQRRFAADLKGPEAIGHEAARRAERMLNPRSAPGGAVPVIFERRVASSVLGHFLSAINGESVARGASFLKDAMGESVFGPGITVMNDPHRRRGLGSRGVDAEGLPTRARALVEEGVLGSWLLSLSSARRLGLEPTGDAVGRPGGAPGASAANAWINAGARSPEAMVSGIERGFLVTSFLGASINPTTGDYSRGASGFWIENGEIAYPVVEATVAGNLLEMFRALEPADDLVFDRSTTAPTLLIEGLHVSA